MGFRSVTHVWPDGGRNGVGGRPTHLHVKPEVSDGGVRLELQANGPFEYTTFRASESLYVLDISGVSVGDAAGLHIVRSELIKSYGGRPIPPARRPWSDRSAAGEGRQPRVERTDAQDVELVVSRNANAAATAPAKGTSRRLRPLPRR